ncbi:MAG TPA: hypothetical protein VJO52_02205 [Gemmatimonadaceae bacterium]|nr:hypothetical protein [Gemmatimonadaceae bacterium]
MEFDPMSIAATRSVRPLGERGAVRRSPGRTVAGRCVGVPPLGHGRDAERAGAE